MLAEYQCVRPVRPGKYPTSVQQHPRIRTKNSIPIRGQKRHSWQMRGLKELIIERGRVDEEGQGSAIGVDKSGVLSGREGGEEGYVC